jgi:sulfotransferase family protein
VADAGVAAADALRDRLARVRARHRDVLVLVAPPRTASTALARVLWNHRAVGWYRHEPFEPTYYEDAPAEVAVRLLEEPTPVGELNPSRAGEEPDPAGALVVKEMTFQVGDAFPVLASLATRPIVFVIRDPRLSVASRMRVLARAGRPEVFPLRESGWDDLARQLAWVRDNGVPHLVVDSHDLRAAPEAVIPRVLSALGLPYSPALLTWESSAAKGLSVVSGEGDPFYERVLESRGIEAPAERIPDLTDFPTHGGFRAHVAECVARYEALRPICINLTLS